MSHTFHNPLPAFSAGPIPVTAPDKRSLPPLADVEVTGNVGLISPVVARAAVRFADFAITTVLGLAIALLYIDDADRASQAGQFLAIVLTGSATVAAFELFGLYKLNVFTSFMGRLPQFVFGWTIAFFTLLVILFFLKMGADVSRVWLTIWYLAGAAALIANRSIVAVVMRGWAKSGRLYQRAAIYGASNVTSDVIAQLEADRDQSVRIVGIFDDRRDRAPSHIKGYAVQGGLQDLISLSRTTRLDLVVVALPMQAENRLTGIVKKLSVLPSDIKMPARATSLRFSPRTYSHVGSVAMIDLYDKPIADWGTVSKWLFDKVFSICAIIVFAPVMVAIALAVKLDSRGPVLFRQKRFGFNNEEIEVLKFRSLFADRCDANATVLVTRTDSRVTRVGRFIRRTSLDELPQFFNVLLGHLSLVGPRPHALKAMAASQLYDEVVDGYFARHKVKPGITGWAQINGWRGETDTPQKIQKRVEYDLYYIENWSVFLDLYILFMTPWSLVKAQNAY